MEKNKLVNFVAKVMEQSGFKVYKNFQTSRHIIDIYGILPSILGDVGVVVAVKNYDEGWEVGLDVLKEMEMVAKTLKASKIVVVSSSYFTDNAVNYAGRRNIKLLDKDDLVNLAKKFSNRSFVDAEEDEDVDVATDEAAEYEPAQKSRGLSFFSGSRKSLNKGGKSSSVSRPIGPTLNRILGNTISLIVIVLLISSLITYLVSLSDGNNALIGISKIVSSAILSYGLVLYFERDFMATLVKGTTVFFVSLIIYVILILIF
jgi:hypothetical protein